MNSVGIMVPTLFYSACLLQEAGDKSELRRHIYANGVDRHMVRRLLQKVFVPCSCTKNTNKKCPGHEVAIEVDDIVKLLDIPQEIVSTLLCYLELHPKKFIKTLPSVYVNAKVTSYNGPMALKAAAQSVRRNRNESKPRSYL